MSKARVWVVTLCHVDIHVLDASLNEFYATTKYDEFYTHILVDHHWPINTWQHRHDLLYLAERYRCKVMTPYENVGGAGGLNWAMQNLPWKEGDLLLGYDPDSFPKNKNWVTAMADVLKDPKYGGISLKINADLFTKEWDREVVNYSHRVMRPAKGGIEMFNVSMWDMEVIDEIGGFHDIKYYGGVETPLLSKFNRHGFKHGYLEDYTEDLRPVEPHPEYIKWKSAHVKGDFNGNFCDWVEQKQIM